MDIQDIVGIIRRIRIRRGEVVTHEQKSSLLLFGSLHAHPQRSQENLPAEIHDCPHALVRDTKGTGVPNKAIESHDFLEDCCAGHLLRQLGGVHANLPFACSGSSSGTHSFAADMRNVLGHEFDRVSGV